MSFGFGFKSVARRVKAIIAGAGGGPPFRFNVAANSQNIAAVGA